MTTGTFVWHEVMTTKRDEATNFYKELFDWTVEEVEMGGPVAYRLFKSGEKTVGGLMAAPEGTPTHWLAYIGVDDVDVAAKNVPEMGGKVLVPPTDIPNMGRFTVVQDSQDAGVGFFASPEGAESSDPDAKPTDFSVCWTELVVDDQEAGAKFYGPLTGWSAEPMGPEMLVFKSGDKARASCRKLSPEAKAMGAPPHWLTYILVPDIDTYVGKAQKLGGSILVPHTSIPNMGSFSVISDPTGGAFAIWKEEGSAEA